MIEPDAGGSPAGGENADLIDALVQSAFVVTAAVSKVVAEYDMSLTQLRVLAILRDRRPRMTELADYLGLDKSSMSGLIDRAEKRNLVRRVANATDRRATDVLLTPDGVALADQLFLRITTSLLPTTSALPPSDQRRLLHLLTMMLGTATMRA